MELFILSLATNQSDTNGMFAIGFPEIARALGSLVVVIVLSMLVLMCYGRRMSHLHSSSVMRVVDMVPLERNARIYLVRVRDTYVLVGVSKEGVTHLCTLGNKSEVHLEPVEAILNGAGDIGLEGFGGFLKRAVERMRPKSNGRKIKETNNETTD